MSNTRKRDPKGVRQQFAALPCQSGANGPMVMLVTTRGTGSWVLPKGWPKKKLSGAEIAALEAFEEAGIVGDVVPAAVGSYRYLKRMPDNSTVHCDVEVYPLQVKQLLEDWPERKERQRQWFTFPDAANAVRDHELTTLLRRLADVPWAA